MDSHDESAETFDDIIRSLQASSHYSSPKKESHQHVNQKTDHLQANPLELYSSIADTFPSGVLSEAATGIFSPSLTSPFQSIMMAPTMAIEPPTSQDEAFHFVDISNASRAISRSQAATNFGSPLKASSLSLQKDAGIFHSSPPEMFSPSPSSSPGALTVFPISSQNLCGDHLSFTYPKAFGVPIARSNIKSQHPGIPAARKASRHHRDLSGTSSTASTISGPPYDISSAIDPSALQSPFRRIQTDLEFGSGNGETAHIISPFVNQVVEQRPDGTFTGRYSRPMTSTGRPSHARKTPPGHVKRPRNAFILFRSYACSSNLIPPSVEKDHRQISRIVSHMWRSLPSEERLIWERQAEEEKELHRKLHPDYRYKPVYRKENAGKKNQTRLGSSAAARKKANSRKINAKGSDGLAECGDLSQPQDPEDLAGTRERKCSADLQREHDEEIRCEAVAKVLLETKLAGITLDEVQMEERVLEQVRLVKINEAHQIQSQQSGNDNPNSKTAASTGTKKPKNKLLAPLQCRRKSFLNRSNSAPPPPSPLRMMEVREVVYNPKARGNRELSPDFPKPKVMEQEEDMLMMIPSDEQGLMEHETYPVHFHPQFHSDHQFHPIVHPGMIRNPAYLHYQLTLSSPEDFEPLFPAPPDFSFPDETCFHPPQNHVAEEFFNSHMNQNEIHKFNNGDFSSNLESPLTGPTSSEQAETTNSMAESKSPDQENVIPGDSLMCEEGEEMKGEYAGESRGKGGGTADPAGNTRRTSLSIFTPAMRRRSSVMMTFSEGSNPGLEAALELARKNAAGSDQHPSLQEEHEWRPSQQPRRQSVLLSGLGEFPVVDLPPSMPESAQVTILDYPWPEPQTTRESEHSSGRAHEHITPGYNTAPSSSERFGDLAPKGLAEPTEAVTFNSAIGQDGHTYLFLTKEQAETEGLIAQILDAGFGVTYESNQPPLPNL